jgi:CheY-like chemotaxis protein
MATEATVLLVEDDEHDVFFMQRAFAKAQINNPLVAVGDGLEAMWYLKGEGPYADRAKHPPAGLMLLDLKMARVGGFEVLTWLQEQPKLRATLKVVVLSSSNREADIRKALELGADEYLVKPFDTNGLADMVKDLSRRYLAAPQ